MGKDRQCVIFPVKCREDTAKCCFNLVSLLKAEKLVGQQGMEKGLGYMKV